MRKALLIVALLAVAFAAMPAWASSTIPDASNLTTGTYQAKFLNFSDLYYAAGTTSDITGGPSTAGANGAPLLFGAPATALVAAAEAYAAGGSNARGTLENRAIFNATSITNTGTGGTVWNGNSQQLSGLFYNLTLAGVTLNGTIATLDFVPDTNKSTPLNVSALPVGSGGVIQIYNNTTLPWASAGNAPDPNGVGVLSPAGKTPASVNSGTQVNNGTGPWGPSSWVAGTGSTSDTYVGASTGSIWLEGAFVPFSLVGITAADGDGNTVFEEDINLATGTSVAEAEGFVDFTGGTEYANIALGAQATAGINVDMTLLADESTPGQTTPFDPATNLLTAASGYSGLGYWPVDSEDPVTFSVTVVPEPATLSLLGFGLVGLLARRRKK